MCELLTNHPKSCYESNAFAEFGVYRFRNAALASHQLVHSPLFRTEISALIVATDFDGATRRQKHVRIKYVSTKKIKLENLMF